MTCGEYCSTHGCTQEKGCVAHRQHYDTLQDRIVKGLTSDTYSEDLIAALIMAAFIALPFAIYFWRI